VVHAGVARPHPAAADDRAACQAAFERGASARAAGARRSRRAGPLDDSYGEAGVLEDEPGLVGHDIAEGKGRRGEVVSRRPAVTHEALVRAGRRGPLKWVATVR
jgi:hypothetical protein